MDSLNNKTRCSQHGTHVMDCFELHHQPVEVEMVKLHLPCGHLSDRPTKGREVIVCDSGEHKWEMTFDVSNMAWNAVRA